MCVKILVTITMVATMDCFAWGQDDCTLKKDNDGIKVYACHSDTARFRFIKATVILSATLAELEEFLRDIPNYPDWQYNMEESDVLEAIHRNEFIYRSVIRAPWPVSNREMIVHLRMVNTSQNSMTIEVNSVAHDHPEDKKLVRVPYSEAIWEVTQVNETDLSIHYSMRIDPGGSIPAWLVNMAITEGPYITFKRLKEQIGSR